MTFSATFKVTATSASEAARLVRIAADEMVSTSDISPAVTVIDPKAGTCRAEWNTNNENETAQQG